MQLFSSKSQTAAKFAALVAISAALAPVCAQDAIIASIADQISQDIVAARSSDIPLSQASSEVSSFIAAITGNADMNNLFKSLFNAAANGVNNNNLVEFAQQAASSLMAYSDSPEFTSLQGIIAANTGNYDLDQITSNLDDSFEPMLAQITPQVTALEVSDYDANFEDAMNDLYYAALNVGYGAIYGAQGNEYDNFTAEDGSTDESTDGSTDESTDEFTAAQLVGAGSIHFAAGTIPFAAAASASSFFMNMKGSASSIKARGTTTRSGRTITIAALAARSTESAAETAIVSSLSSSASEDVSSAVETSSSATTESSSDIVSSASSVTSSSSASSSAAASSAAATSSQAQPGDANSRAVTGAFLMGGAVIAVANYLL